MHVAPHRAAEPAARSRQRSQRWSKSTELLARRSLDSWCWLWIERMVPFWERLTSE
ncbi:MAG: hypothetical protein ACR2JO_01460 [Mycobacteriales bacterium]